MQRVRYDEYIRRFNAEDASAFDEFLTKDVVVQNGRLRYSGVQGMKEHYARIWGRMKETLQVQRYVSDGHGLAVQMHTRFDVLVDALDSPFGPIQAGERFDYYGVVMYRLNESQFDDIKVAYLDFTRTGRDGLVVSLGIPH